MYLKTLHLVFVFYSLKFFVSPTEICHEIYFIFINAVKLRLLGNYTKQFEGRICSLSLLMSLI